MVVLAVTIMFLLTGCASGNVEVEELIAQGNSFIQDKDYQSAIGAFTNAQKLDPQNESIPELLQTAQQRLEEEQRQKEEQRRQEEQLKEEEERKKVEELKKDPEAYLKYVIHQKFGEKAHYSDAESISVLIYDEAKKDVFVEVFGTTKLLSTDDAVEVVRTLRDYEYVRSVKFHILRDWKDAYGNVAPIVAMRMNFTEEVIDKINWDTFNFENVPDVVEEYYIHPEFK